MSSSKIALFTCVLFCALAPLAVARNATKDVSEFLLTPEHMAAYKWGTYKPMTLFSVQDRQDAPTSFAIMWYPTGTRDIEGELVYYTSDLKDPRDTFYYDYHNGRNLTIQHVKDHANNVHFTITWVKTKEPQPGEHFWEASVVGEQIDPNGKALKLTVLFIATSQLEKSYFEVLDKWYHTEYTRKCHTRSELCSDAEEALLYRFGSKAVGAKGNTLQIGLNVADRSGLWNVRDFVSAYYKNFTDFTDDVQPQPTGLFGSLAGWLLGQSPMQNLGAQKRLPLNSTLVGSLNRFEGKVNLQLSFMATQNKKANSISFGSAVSKSNSLSREYDKLFKNKYQLKHTYYEALVPYFRQSLSNLFGSIGYFSGTVEVRNQTTNETRLEKRSFLAPQPARDGYPMVEAGEIGYLLLSVYVQDHMLGMDLLHQFFQNTDETGYMPRFTLLGEEAAEAVKCNFVKRPQSPKTAHTPSVFLALREVKRVALFEDWDSVDRDFLNSVFDHAERYANWFLETQRTGSERSFKLQWKNAHPGQIPQSGMRDYPRAQVVLPDQVHVDLMGWAMEAFDTVEDMAGVLDIPASVGEAHFKARKLREALDRATFIEEQNKYADFNGANYYKNLTGNTQSDSSSSDANAFFNMDTHNGLVNLFPLLFNQLGNPERLNGSLDLMLSASMLSKHGLRSLSRYDLEYHEGRDGWRGNVWVKSNFLALRSLNKYHKRFNRGVGAHYSVDDAEQLLKNGLLTAAWVEWQDKGVFVEAIDDRTGKAVGRKRFANINALLLLISADFFA